MRTLQATATSVLAAGCLAAVTTASSQPTHPTQGEPRHDDRARPLALVYRGPGGCGGCSDAVGRLLRNAPRHFRVRYVGPRDITPARLSRATVYAQPGGNGSVRHAARALGKRNMRRIRRYVRHGGHYLGFCMGAYLAGSRPGIGLLSPGNTARYVGTPGAEVPDDRNAVIPVRWRGKRDMQFAQDPPYIIASHVRGERVLSRFTSGRINALVRPYGRGAVGVVGTHPEATRDWYARTLWRRDTDGLDRRQALDLLAATLRR